MIGASGCALPKHVNWQEQTGTQVPEVKKAFNHYPELDVCQTTLLFQGKPRVTVMVVDGLDLSGKRDYYNGFYLSQGFAGYVMDVIKRTAPHIKLIDGTRMARDVIAWMKLNAAGGDAGNMPWQAPPGVDYILIIEVPSLDFKKGMAAEAEVFKVGAGIRTYGGLVSLVARLVHRSGDIVAVSNVRKDVPGVTAYLKTGGIVEGMMVRAHLEAGEHEAFQNAVSALSHVADYDIWAQFYGDRQCDKDAKGIFDGDTTPQGVPPYKQYGQIVPAQNSSPSAARQAPVAQTSPPQCPLGVNEYAVEVILYNGHNNDTFDPENNLAQRKSLLRLREWQNKGCAVKVIEGARCPKTPAPGVVLARAVKPADWLGKIGPRPEAVEMSSEKLKNLHATCKKPDCDEDTYPWFFAAYATIVRP